MTSIPNKESWCEELGSVRSSVTQLQATMRNILTKSPNLQQLSHLVKDFDADYDPNNSISIQINNFLHSPQLKVAAKLKSIHESNELTLFGPLSAINFKNYLNDVNFHAVLNHSKSKSESITEETNIDITNWPPLLPEINDEKTRTLVFIDQSAITSNHVLQFQAPKNYNNLDNKKLAIKGDGLLHHALEELLDEKLPNLDSKELTILRLKLMNHEMLTKLTLTYGLQQLLRHQIPQDCRSENKMKIYADLFLAYLGALSSQIIFEEMKKWINILYDPIVNEFSKASQLGQPLERAAKGELEFLFYNNLKGKINYIQMEKTPFVVKCCFNDEILAFGTSSKSLEEAETNAAKTALQNKESIQKLLVTEEGAGVSKPFPETRVSKPFAETQKEVSSPLQSEFMHQRNPYQESHSVKETTAQSSSSFNVPHQKHTDNIPHFEQEPPIPLHLPKTGLAPYSTPLSMQSPLFSLSKTSQASPSPLLPNSQSNIAPPFQGPSSYQNHATQSTKSDAPEFPSNQYSINSGSMYEMNTSSSSPRDFIDYNAKNNLYALLGTHHLNPIYKFMKVGMEFHARVLVKDVILGEGRDFNKKLASQRAAMSALENKNGLLDLGVTKL